MPEIATEIPKRRNAPLPALQKQGIVADHVAGMSNKQLAAKWQRHPATISRVINELRKAQPQSLGTVRSIQDIRASLTGPATTAVHRALTDASDPYKSGNIGVAVLKGVGVLQDTQSTSTHALIMATPAAMRDAFLEACCDAPVIESGTIADPEPKG
jgi:hypothetical protein